MCGCLSCVPTEDLASNPGMCPDGEPNRSPFDSRGGAQSTEPHQPGSAFVDCFNDQSLFSAFHFQHLFFLFFGFIGVTLANKIIQVSGAQFHNTSSVHCMACSPPQVKSPSVTIYPSSPGDPNLILTNISESLQICYRGPGLCLQSAVFSVDC